MVQSCYMVIWMSGEKGEIGGGEMKCYTGYKYLENLYFYFFFF